MPLYEYECGSCRKRFERIQKFSDPLVDTCPSCGGPVKKLLSSPAFHFKGTGWYATDYPKQSPGEDSQSKSESSSNDSSAGAASNSESAAKPAAKPAATTPTTPTTTSTTKSD